TLEDPQLSPERLVHFRHRSSDGDTAARQVHLAHGQIELGGEPLDLRDVGRIGAIKPGELVAENRGRRWKRQLLGPPADHNRHIHLFIRIRDTDHSGIERHYPLAAAHGDSFSWHEYPPGSREPSYHAHVRQLACTTEPSRRECEL